MKTILYVFQYEMIGGPHLRVLQIAKQLKKKYHSVIILPCDGNAGDEFRRAGITTYEICLERIREPLNLSMFLRYIFLFIPTTFDILKIIKREAVDIVVVNNSMLLQAPIAAKLAGTKLIWHLEETIAPLLIKNILGLLIRILADQVIVVSKAVQDFFYKNRLPKSKIAIIHAPVDPCRFKPDISPSRIRNELGLSQDVPVIGIIGNINPIKGHSYFLEAAFIIKNTYPDAKFLIVGSKLKNRETYFESLLDYCNELNLNENVIFTGGRQDIPEIMAALDILVLSSLAEACPMVVLEAMATGKPVVATRVGGLPEEVVDGKTGILVTPKNPQAIADAVLSLLADKERMQQMGRVGRVRVIKHFTVQAAAQKTDVVYAQLLGMKQ